VSRKSFRIALIVVAATVLIAGGIAAYFIKVALDYPTTPHDGSGKTVVVEVERGMSLTAIANRLEQADVIDKPRWFRLYAMNKGADRKVRIGKYELRDNMSPEQVLEVLMAGVEDVTVAVTFKEGWNMLEVFEAIAAAGVADAAALEALCRKPEFLEQHGIEGDTCDGYLFPETYRFRVPSPPDKVIERLIEQHRIVWGELRHKYADKVERLKTKLDWTDRDLLILASIVEKEAVVDGERPRIAQVFINRLTSPSFQPKRLETDPTIRYGCLVPMQKSAACREWDKTDRLHRKQLDDKENPYNTYQHDGLPPGPIGNPGRRSLAAAMNPDRSKFFFFVSRNDGTHVFSKTYKEHTKWVNKFQR
jgi:UPF0755 protein